MSRFPRPSPDHIAPMGTGPLAFFYTFISYTASDAAEAGSLHKLLESYRFPRRLRGTVGKTGIAVPTRLFPCYLDKEELATDRLTDGITSAIGRSKSLTVVCSPQVLASHWVDAEVRCARDLGLPCHAWVVGGTAPDCFPAALRGANEPGGCDPRPPSRGYRSWFMRLLRCVPDWIAARRARRRALLRLIAAIVVVDLADLVRRDLARRRLVATVAGLTLVVLASVLATLTKNLVDQQRTGESRALATASLQAADPDEALQLAIQAMEAGTTLQSEQAISQAIENQHARAILNHDGEVFRIEFSADGRWLLSGGDNGEVGLWDVAAAMPRRRLNGLHDAINQIAFSPDGSLASAADNSGRLMIWDASTGFSTATFAHQTDKISSYVFLPDGRTVVSVSDSGVVARWSQGRGDPVWQRKLTEGASVIRTVKPAKEVVVLDASSAIRFIDVSTGQDRRVFKPERANRRPDEGQEATIAVLSDDEKHIAVGYKDGQIWAIDTATGRGRWLSGHHSAGVESLAFAPDGRYLAAAGDDSQVIVWNRDDWSQSGSYRHTRTVYSVAYSPDSRWLATGSADRTAVLRDADGTARVTLRGHTDAAFHLAFSPDGQTLATASTDRTIRLWRLARRVPTQSFPHEARINVTCRLNADKFLLAAGPGFATVWETDSWRRLSDSRAGQVTRAACASRGDIAALGYANGNVEVFRITNTGLQSLWSKQAHSMTLEAMAISRDGQLLVTAGSEGGGSHRLRAWTSTGEVVDTPDVHRDVVSEVGFTPDESAVYTVSLDRTLKVWSRSELVARDGVRPLAPLYVIRPPLPSDGLTKAIFSDAGDKLLTTDRNGVVRLWTVASKSEEWVLRDQKPGPFAVLGFSADQKAVWTITGNGFTRLTDIARPDAARLTIPSGMALSLVLSPSTSHVAIASNDSTSIWDADTRMKMHTLPGHDPRFWRGGETVSTVDGSRVLLFDLTPAALLAQAKSFLPTRVRLPR